MNPSKNLTNTEDVTELKQYVHSHGTPARGSILMVASSPTTSEITGWPIGFWASELTHPLLRFRESGYDITLASTEGGPVEMDAYSNPADESGYSADDVVTLGFMQLQWFKDLLTTTKKITDIDPDEYDAIFLVGGQGPMYTFRNNKSLETLFASFLEAGKPSAAVCHATALLLDAKGSDGERLVKDKTWTGFSNAEETFVEESIGQKVQPFWIEDEARKLDHTTFIVSHPFSSYAVKDGNLITGQQQNSGSAAASLVIDQLTRQS